MNEPTERTRREFLRDSALGAAILGALANGLSLVRPAQAHAQSGLACPLFGVFDAHTFETLAHVAEQIVPADQEPGGMDTCLASFVEVVALGDAAFGGFMTFAVTALDDSSQVLPGEDFAELSFDEQTELLQQVEANTAPGTEWSKLGPGGQAAWFGAVRTLIKVAWVSNWPETTVRDRATGVPILADPEHLISDPNVPDTGTGWDVMHFHAIDWEVEQLLWAWQGGLRVIDFDGTPVLDEDDPLSDAERLAARDALYELSDAGKA